MKCSACSANKCDGDSDYSYRCTGKEEGIDCTCTCHESAAAAFFSKGLSILGGAAAVVGGIGFTVATGGLGAAVIGAAVAGAGSSLVINPIQKTIAGEQMTVGDTLKDVALGATIGAVTGPIGAGGSALAKGAGTAAKLGIRVAAGSGAGAVSGAISETARAINGEEVSVGSFAKSIGVGAVVGSVGGAASHTASAASNKVTNEFVKAATRVGVQGGAAAATDAGLQLATTGKVDPKQLLINSVGQVAVATSAEVGSSVAQTTKVYATRRNDELMKGNGVSDADRKEFKNILEKMDNLDEKGRSKLDNYKNVGGKNNIHRLKGPRDGQIAASYGPKVEGHKANKIGRVIFEDFKGNPVYVDHTPDHNYEGAKPKLDRNQINNPLKGKMRPENLRYRRCADDED